MGDETFWLEQGAKARQSNKFLNVESAIKGLGLDPEFLPADWVRQGWAAEAPAAAPAPEQDIHQQVLTALRDLYNAHMDASGETDAVEWNRVTEAARAALERAEGRS